MRVSATRSPRPRLGSLALPWLCAGLLGASVALAPALASADVAGPPDDSEVAPLCEEGQKLDADCKTGDGSQGTCVEPQHACGTEPNGDTVYCYECEENCSVAAAGGNAPFRPGGLGGAFALAAAVLLVRRRR